MIGKISVISDHLSVVTLFPLADHIILKFVEGIMFDDWEWLNTDQKDIPLKDRHLPSYLT